MVTPSSRTAAAKLNAADQRSHNRALILNQLFHHGAMSRADLARTTRLTGVSVSDLVRDLIAEGLVTELGLQRGGLGKPSTLVGVNADAQQIAVVDISSIDHVRGALTNLQGEIQQLRIVDYSGTSGTDLIYRIEDLIRELLAVATAPILGIGIASPGIIGPNGQVIAAPNYDWFDLPLAQILSENLGLPVFVANDANAAAVGERSFGGAPDSMMVVTVRGGVGAGLILNGALALGAKGAAGEIGHLVIDATPNARPCACGRRGCLETVLSEPALALVAAQTPEQATNDLTHIGTQLGTALAPVVAALNLSEVRLSGPADFLAGDLRQAAETTILNSVMPISATDFQVTMANGGENIVLIGAAGYVLRALLGIT